MNANTKLLIFLPLLLVSFQGKTADAAPVVAVAANFSLVAEKISNKFSRETGHEILISSGASGTLTRQIKQGAPFELFLSADENYPLKLYELGLTRDKGKIYAKGKLVLYVPGNTCINKMQNLDNILHQLVADNSCKIAIANPGIAPYGYAAQQVLEQYTEMIKLQGRLILGENVGQTAQFALTESVDAAFLPYSLTLTSKMQEAGYFEMIPEEWYTSINQRMVLLKNAGQVALEFYNYLSSEAARKIIQNYGYSLPD